MSPTEFLTVWAALLVGFVLVLWWMAPGDDFDPFGDYGTCPPHVWDHDTTGGLRCLRCGEPPSD